MTLRFLKKGIKNLIFDYWMPHESACPNYGLIKFIYCTNSLNINKLNTGKTLLPTPEVFGTYIAISGKIKRFKAFDSHLLTKKSPRRKRALAHPTLVSKADKKRIKKLLPYD